MKTCPILKAGVMVTMIYTETSHTTVHKVHHESPGCIGDKCEWYGYGCPAHPKYSGYAGKTPPRGK